MRFARAGIAGYKVPYGVSVMAELPLLASGKPDRRELARGLQIPRGRRRGGHERVSGSSPGSTSPASPLFAGLGDSRARRRSSSRCARASSPPASRSAPRARRSDRLWLITGGLVHILAGSSDAAAGEVVARQRKGDAIGAQGVITGEPRTATAVASDPHHRARARRRALRRAGAAVSADPRQPDPHPEREPHQAPTRARVERERGETVALVGGPALAAHDRARGGRRAQREPASGDVDRPAPVVRGGADRGRRSRRRARDGAAARRARARGARGAARGGRPRGGAGRLGAEDAQRLGALARGPDARGAQVEAVLIGEEALAASREWPRGRAAPRGARVPAGGPRGAVDRDARLARRGGRLAPRRSGVAGAPPHAHQAGTRARSRRRQGLRARGRAAGARGGGLRGRLRVRQQHRRDRRHLPRAGHRTPRRSTRRCAAPSTPTTWRELFKTSLGGRGPRPRADEPAAAREHRGARRSPTRRSR